MVLLCHACHTTMSSRCHDDRPFGFRASLLSFIVAHVLHFVSHNLAMSPSIVSLHAYAHCRMLSQELWFLSGAFIIDQLHRYNCYKCFYNTLSRCMHWPIWRSCIACSLLVEITCRRNYLCLQSLDAWIGSGRSLFNPFQKLPSTQFCSNVVWLHGDAFFLPSSSLLSIVWLESSTSCISQSNPSSPFLIR